MRIIVKKTGEINNIANNANNKNEVEKNKKARLFFKIGLFLTI